MHDSTTVFLINDDVRAIKARYWKEGETPSRDLGRQVEIFKTFDDSIEVGDLVVVENGKTTRHGMSVVQVTEVDYDINFESDKDVKWVVTKIDNDAFQKLLEQERDAITTVKSAEKRRKRDELKASLYADQDAKIKALALANNKAEVESK